MPIRYFQPGDDDNTVFRKLLENDTQTLSGALTVSIGAAGGSVAPQTAALGDSRNDLLRKILINQSQIMAGNMTAHLR